MRADARGCTVVDGGPGTGKTVVALHRAAYLSFSRQDGVLYVTKHAGLAAYVRTCCPARARMTSPSRPWKTCTPSAPPVAMTSRRWPGSRATCAW